MLSNTSTQNPAASRPPYAFSLITSAVPDRLTKRAYLDSKGQVVKEKAGSMAEGQCKRMSVGGPAEFAALLPRLETDQALLFGVAALDNAHIVTKAKVTGSSIARTDSYLPWPAGPGVLMLDCDPAPGSTPLSRKEFLAVLVSVCPELKKAPMVVVSSASSHLYHTDTGDCIKGEGGLRGYVFVVDARDIPRAGAVLFKRLWLAGHGFGIVSASGQMLVRGTVDAAVWQSARLDFAAGMDCVEPLKQMRPDPDVYNQDAPPLDTKAHLLDLTDAETKRFTDLKTAERERLKDEIESTREKWVVSRVEQHVAAYKAKTNLALGEAELSELKNLYRRAVECGKLFADFILELGDGSAVSVETILNNPDTYHNTYIPDPLEPGYADNKTVAWINLRSGGRPFVYSHAHGGRRYELLRASERQEFGAGDVPRLVRAAEERLAIEGNVFQRGGELVRVAGGEILTVTAPWLKNWLEDVFEFNRWHNSGGKWVRANCPEDLPARIIADRGAWCVPELKGVILGPVMRLDGSLLDQPGFDAATELLFLSDKPDAWPSIPNNPTPYQLEAAMHQLWKPFRMFPFARPFDRAVALAALLTAIVRAVLPTAPAIAMDAPAAGSGKTKLAESVAALTGKRVSVAPAPTDNEELRKALLGRLSSGNPAILFDNVDQALKSSVLCEILTADKFSDRKLGVNDHISVSTRVLIIFTGNNFRPVGDLTRRVLKCRLDHGVERPDKQAFDFDPVKLATDEWMENRVAGLTLLRGFIAAGCPKGEQGTLGSFEDWDRLIRQAVIWIGKQGFGGLELDDPIQSIEENVSADPDTNNLAAILKPWHALFGNKPVTVKKLIGARHLVASGGEISKTDEESLGQLREAMEEIAGQGRDNALNRVALGRWIENRVGRILCDLRIDVAGKNDGSKAWRVSEVECPF
jgi:hypothetical protein